MHELKFLIKSWKKNQRLLRKKSHVRENDLPFLIFNNFSKNLFFEKSYFIFLDIKEVDLWHEKGGIRDEKEENRGNG